MLPCTTPLPRRTLSALALFVSALVASAQTLTFTPLKSGGIYETGEKIGWTIEVAGDQKPGVVSYVLKKNGAVAYKTDTVDLSSGKATIETSLDEPGSVLLEITLPVPPPAAPAAAATADAAITRPANATPARGGRGNRPPRALAGAMVAPRKLQPASPRPADFDAWWTQKIAQLHAIPANPQLTPGESGKDGVDYALLQMDNINGTRVQGQIAKPKREGRFPALLILQWAGVYPLQKQWVIDRAAEGWLALNILPHDLPPTEPAAFYQGKLGNYASLGQEDREQSYFLRMYLGDYRAADYLAAHPNWDGRTLVVMGTSMGGQQTFATAGLHPKITAMMAMVPAGADNTGPEHGRASSYPGWANATKTRSDPRILETGRYFDSAHFASRVKVPALVAMGFIDETCPPVSVWAALNQLKGPVEPLPLINSPHQDNPRGVQRPWQVRSAEWLAAIVKGEAVKMP